MSWEILVSPAAAPAWAFVGATLVKVLDWALVRFKDRDAAKVSQHEVVNASTKLLIDSMMAQIASLSKMTSELQAELRVTHRELDDKIERVLQLEAEIVIIRREAEKRTASRRRRPESEVSEDSE